jgi:hypothetical protein
MVCCCSAKSQVCPCGLHCLIVAVCQELKGLWAADYRSSDCRMNSKTCQVVRSVFVQRAMTCYNTKSQSHYNHRKQPAIELQIQGSNLTHQTANLLSTASENLKPIITTASTQGTILIRDTEQQGVVRSHSLPQFLRSPCSLDLYKSANSTSAHLEAKHAMDLGLESTQ